MTFKKQERRESLFRIGLVLFLVIDEAAAFHVIALFLGMTHGERFTRQRTIVFDRPKQRIFGDGW